MDAAAIAKAKSDERRAHLEVFRAAQAAKRAASLGQKVAESASAPAKAAAPRLAARKPSQQRDPNKPTVAGKSNGPTHNGDTKASVKPARPLPGSVMGRREPQTSLATQAEAKPPVPSRPASKAAPKDAPAVEGAGKGNAWMEAQQAFGCETSRPSESRRASQAGEVATATGALGHGFGDNGDPNMGIRWQLQMEQLRLQQWRILNTRMQASQEKQQEQAEAQIRQAAEAVVALKHRVAQERTRQRLQQNSQQAAEVLAAQVPRLELYQGMSEQHEQNVEAMTQAFAAALQQMPLVNGATCGSSADVVDAEKMRAALQGLRGVMAGLLPRIAPFNAPKPSQAGGNEATGFLATATAAKELAEVDDELRACLATNCQLLHKLEIEVLHTESLAVQLLQTQQAC